MSPRKLLLQFASVLAVVVVLNASAQPVTVVEYYNKTLDAHFITGRASEQSALDGVADFQRTGMTFQATAVATAAASLTKICRFYISVATPYVSSHFYGRQGIDCESIRAQNLAGFSWEDYDFATQQPAAGVCPVGTVTIFRGFRAAANGKTSNHRYSASQATYDAAVASGYIGEGAAFCVTAATAATPTTVAVATAVGTPNGTAISASIGPSGGTLTSADGRLTLTVPANAVANSTTLSIQPISNAAPGATGSAYRMLPDGQTFAVPVKLSFAYDDQSLRGSDPDALGVVYQNGQGFWRSLKTVQRDTVNHTLTVSTSHFSDWTSHLTGLQLQPGEASVAVGKSIGLLLVSCNTYEVGEDLQSLALACVPPFLTATTSGWAVNGAPGGVTGLGLVAKTSGISATYTAPATKPSPNRVIVSAELVGAAKKTIFASNITIIDDSWSGRATATTEFFRQTADIKWTLLRINGNVSAYQPSGTASGVDFHCPITPASAPISPGDGILMVDYSTDPPTWSGAGATAWSAVHACPAPEVSYSDQVFSIFFGSDTGVVSAGGTTIEGTNVQGPLTIVWKFTR